MGFAARTQRILLVDDDAAFREQLADDLAFEGLAVGPAADPTGALAALAEAPFDRVLTGLLTRPAERTPTVPLTAHQEVQALGPVHLGISTIVTTPLDRDAFHYAIRAILRAPDASVLRSHS